MKELNIKDSLKQKIYNAIDYEFIDESLIRNNYYYDNMDSNNSFVISNTKEKNKPDLDSSKCDLLKEVFEITNSINFDKAYKDAVSGPGHENRRITVMHSSSLCALLCFYNVSKDNPIIIGNDIYDDVRFEIENEVFKNPSSIDVVLISHKNKKILFLESKFSEYLTKANKNNISMDYLDFYNKYNINTYYDLKINNNVFSIEPKEKNEPHYCEGIKQMISHYIGLKNFIKNKKSYDNGNVNPLLLENGYDIYLGEILFNGWPELGGQISYFDAYKQAYENLVSLLPNNEGIHLLPNILTYQDIFAKRSNKLDNNVRRYYKL